MDSLSNIRLQSKVQLPNKRRCFAFGCSYTSWMYPTFADLVGVNFEEFYNFGRSGCDNNYILNRLVETNELFKFNPKTDFILVGITSVGRYSHWDNVDDWICAGDVFSLSDNFKTAEFAKTIYNEIWAGYRSTMAILNIRDVLKAYGVENIVYPTVDNVDYLSGNYMYNDVPRKAFIPIVTEHFNKAFETLTITTCIDQIRKEANNQRITYTNDPSFDDDHPTTSTYYYYLKKYFSAFDTDKTKEVVKLFSAPTYNNVEELKNYFMKNYIVNYRKEYQYEGSLFLRFSPDGVDKMRKYRETL